MSDLSREAQDLLQRARSFDEPSTADASRVHASVLAKVGVAVGVGAGVTTITPSIAASPTVLLSATVMKIGAALVVVGGLGTAGYVALRTPRATTPVAVVAPVNETRVVEPSMAPVVVAPEGDDALHARATPSERVRGARTRPGVPSSSGDRTARGASELEAEARLLEQADADLRRGDPNGALLRLAEHAAKYPSGALREERQGIRAIALCRAGKEEGKSAAERFLARSPSSSLASRIRAACGE